MNVFAATGRLEVANMRFPIFNRSMLILAFALLAGLLAAWAARQHIQGRVLQLEAQARVPTVQRIVAAHDLPVGTRLGNDHLAVRDFPETLVPGESLAPAHYTRLTGQVLRGALRAGDPILPVHTFVPQREAFSSQIGLGRRAITMPVDRINSVSGLLEPGDLIDLYVSFEYQRRMITAPLLQGVLVLATDTRTRDDAQDAADDPGYTTVTLDASPEDAVKLVAARHSGSITAVLRPVNDSQATVRAARGDLASLLGVNRPPPRPSGRAPVIYGGSRESKVPRLVPSAPGVSQPSGLFDLPALQALVSAWAQANAMTPEAAPFGMPSGFKAGEAQ